MLSTHSCGAVVLHTDNIKVSRSRRGKFEAKALGEVAISARSFCCVHKKSGKYLQAEANLVDLLMHVESLFLLTTREGVDLTRDILEHWVGLKASH